MNTEAMVAKMSEAIQRFVARATAPLDARLAKLEEREGRIAALNERLMLVEGLEARVAALEAEAKK